ncbi:MAG: peptidylprolyl isomerase [Bacteroidota bacterium]|nr:peptidylprolyl isomerase [Bacteroidota bacterium]
MIKKIAFLFLLSSLLMPAFSQQNVDDRIILEVDGEQITVSEFLHIYNKNNKQQSESYSPDSLMNYMDLFVNFKLKVAEARNLGLDTLKKFNKELRGYRSQLTQPYLTDKSVEKELIKEAWERKQKDVKASHVLIKVDQHASPKDTLEAYNKITEIRKKAVSGDADFNELAKKYSGDKSVKRNDGHLGWFTVFGMVYPFETAAYETPVGEVTDIVRTRFGYHIIKVEDKRPAKGRIRVSHIMVLKPKDATQEEKEKAEAKVKEIKQKLDAGEAFDKLAEEYSEDRRSARSGGLLPWFGVGGKMIPEFEEAAFQLNEIDEIAGPVKTSYGYHFIKLIDKEPVGSFEEEKSKIASRISNSARASRSKEVLVEKLKKEYELKLFPDKVEEVHAHVTDSIFHGTWDASEAKKLDGKLLSFANTVLYQKDYAAYLEKYNRKNNPMALETFLHEKVDDYVSKCILMYEEKHLESKYPKFRYLMKEYHDGILLFDVTDKMVWSKAVEDTAGLKAFYEKNKQKYMWGTRDEVKKLNTKNKKLAKNVEKYIKKHSKVTWNEIDSVFNAEDSAAVSKDVWGMFETGENEMVSDLVVEHSKKLNRKGEILNRDDNQVLYIKKIEPYVKKLKEAQGMVTADYQKMLEKEWMNALHNKYDVVIHDDVLNKIDK